MAGVDAIDMAPEPSASKADANGSIDALDTRRGSRKGKGKVGAKRCASGCGDRVRSASSRSRKRLFRHATVGVERTDGEAGAEDVGDMSISITPSSSFV
jgi:hypothetical protein